ncbi:phage integrase SAM-like domain-containing protein [Flavobacterium sp. DG1-102-2]|uniref:phage integrase SAM-like domain-containing protein n=1 Tax=Flavobacterium sp. DG1-102-2 TaxID=3081663 RepID=UPI0029494882|nr:phage integrase SAM-like domain-containing protein [Flavobacterium sp. DG1-102-2]MDV6169495.1 phage integrase SAM-like domain-containing protein [Flavobacterium sp. DG1-102-2]
MASVNFLYRSKKDSAKLNIRLLYRLNGKDENIATNSKLVVTKHYWNNIHNKRVRDIDDANLKADVLAEMNKISTFILTAFDATKPELVDKEWLINILELYYNPHKDEETPNTLVEYIDFYISYRRHELKSSSIQKFTVIRKKMEKLQKQRKKPIYIKDINDRFKNEFVDFYHKENYAQNTIQRELSFIKTFCRHARYMGVETSSQLDSIKVDKEKSEKIYLTVQELAMIKNIDESKLSDSLQNARDWLIISCYTGQRVSDFMRFTKDMIRTEDKIDPKTKETKELRLIEFTQKKTGKLMTILLLKEVLETLNKRDGNFPYSISAQRYNEFIKKVCKIAGINQKIKGSIHSETEPKSQVFRSKTGIYEKWELITSHIGRRSFATNFYGKVPTSYLKYVTGHSTETMFLNYIGKSNKDMAIEMDTYFG